ncbi:MAG: permease-like cell division protein FtsX [Defluviitaleaceae bacterium]|nr:permease-like cell division protein FtsX [Defluviitaleaceae bacterium]
MKPRTIKYFIHEALRSIIYNKFMSIASIFSVASSIFIVVVFYTLGANVEYIMGHMEAQMGMAVRIDENINTADRGRLEHRIRAISNVADVSFVSREEALLSMAESLGEEHVRGLDIDNPLRDSFIVELTDLAFHDDVERAILNLTPYGVADVHSHAEFAQTLSAITNIISIITGILILILTGISIIIITNTIRITVNARKTEINIMKYVGATDWFIRWPFVLEGMIIGLIGGAIPAFITMFTYGRIIRAISDVPMLAFIEFLPEERILIYVFPFSLILGMIIGLIGSITSVKKHLKV